MALVPAAQAVDTTLATTGEPSKIRIKAVAGAGLITDTGLCHAFAGCLAYHASRDNRASPVEPIDVATNSKNESLRSFV